MSVFNGEKYLREAIESILSQTFTDFEFLIIDDGSTDMSLKIIRSFSDLRIRLVVNNGNIGLTKSLNKGIMLAHCEYIARMDADDISLPLRLEKQVRYLNNNPEVVLLGSSAEIINDRDQYVRTFIAISEPKFKDLLKVNQFIHGSIIFRKKIILDLGGYDELFKNGQDYALLLKVIKHYRIQNTCEVLYKLRKHSESIGVKKLEDSILYHILVIRLANARNNGCVIKLIAKNNIMCLKKILTIEEKKYFHNSIAFSHIQNFDLTLARQEYLKIFKLDPYDITNIFNIVCSFLGVPFLKIKNLILINLENFFHEYIQ